MIITALKPSSQKEAWSLRRTAGMIQPLKGTVRLMAGRPGFFRKLLKMLHGHGAGVVVRADGAGDRVVVGADQDPPGGAGTRLDLCDHAGGLDAVIVIGLQTRLDPDPPVEIPDSEFGISCYSRLKAVPTITYAVQGSRFQNPPNPLWQRGISFHS